MWEKKRNERIPDKAFCFRTNTKIITERTMLTYKQEISSKPLYRRMIILLQMLSNKSLINWQQIDKNASNRIFYSCN